MGLRDRLERLEGDHSPELRKDRFCTRLVTTELVLHPNGREERIGYPPPELCAFCPERYSPTPGVQHVEVVLDRRRSHSGELGNLLT